MSSINDPTPTTAMQATAHAETSQQNLERFRRARLSDQAIAEQTLSLSTPLERVEGAMLALLCFRVAGERFALPAACVERVFIVPAVRRIPHRKRAAFRGMVAHEGEILLLGSLERLLDLPGTNESDPSLARMVLLSPAGRGWAFEVNSVDGVVQVRKSDLRAAPGTVTRGLGSATRSLVSLPDGEASLLDPDTLRKGWEASAS